MIFFLLTELPYKIITRGSCKSNGLHMVKSRVRCEAAAKYLGLVDIDAYGGQNIHRPHGCIYASNKWLIWQNPIHHPFRSAKCGSTLRKFYNYECHQCYYHYPYFYRDYQYNCICSTRGKIWHTLKQFSAPKISNKVTTSIEYHT